METNLRLAQEPSTTRPAPTPCLQQQGFRDALQRLTMTLMLVMMTASAAWADASGSCGASGDNVKWTFVSSTHTLTISGTGAMADFADASSEPWYSEKDNIKNLIIEAGVTTIGNNAFRANALNSPVTIPSGVTSIGSNAFRRCESMPSIDIPASVTSIGAHAFENCESLTSFDIPAGVTTIQEATFWKCLSLTSIVIPAGVTSIENNAFYGCKNLSKVLFLRTTAPTVGTGIFDNANPLVFVPAAYTTADGWSSYSSLLWSYDECWTSGEATVFSNNANTTLRVDYIDAAGAMADYADAATLPWTSLAATVTTLEITDGVTTIGQNAFNGFSAVTDVDIPNSVTSIGANAFSGMTSINEVIIPASVTSIGAGAFNGCSSLAMVIAQRSTPPALGANAFDGNAANRKIRAHESYKTADGWNAYASDIVGYSGVWACGGVTLFYDGSTKQMTIEKCNGSGEMGDIQDYEDRPWDGIMDDIETIVVESGVTKIGYNAFHGCGNLTTVTIAETVTTIGSIAFRYCSNLATVYMMPATPPEANSQQFDNCSDDLFIIVPGEYYNTYYKNGYWTNYRERLAGMCGTNVKFNYASSSHKLTISGMGVMADYTDESTQPWHSYRDDLQTVVIEPGVTSIGTKAFSSCGYITSLTIGSDVTTIGTKAFESCIRLLSIHIPASVTSIGEDAFAYCTNVPAITVAAGNTVYDSRDNCNAIIETNTNKLIHGCINTKIPATVTEIGKNAFENCNKTAITIPYGVTTIGNQAFGGCAALTSVSIPASVTSIEINAFIYCFALTSVTIYAPSLTKYGDYAFEKNAAGRKIYVFSNCVDTYKNGWYISDYDIEALTLSVHDAGGELGSWCTYYNGLADVTVAEGTTVYTAKRNNTGGVTLTETGSRIIKKGEAVLLKSTADIGLSSAADSGEGVYTGNELKGVDYETAQDANTTYYVLSKVNGVFGFYKLARKDGGDSLNLGANKAYLTVATPPSSAPEYLGFGDDDSATSISTTDRTDSTDKADEWYNLDGRKLSGEPSAKGVYVKNGRKFIIK